MRFVALVLLCVGLLSCEAVRLQYEAGTKYTYDISGTVNTFGDAFQDDAHNGHAIGVSGHMTVFCVGVKPGPNPASELEVTLKGIRFTDLATGTPLDADGSLASVFERYPFFLLQLATGEITRLELHKDQEKFVSLFEKSLVSVLQAFLVTEKGVGVGNVVTTFGHQAIHVEENVPHVIVGTFTEKDLAKVPPYQLSGQTMHRISEDGIILDARMTQTVKFFQGPMMQLDGQDEDSVGTDTQISSTGGMFLLLGDMCTLACTWYRPCNPCPTGHQIPIDRRAYVLSDITTTDEEIEAAVASSEPEDLIASVESDLIDLTADPQHKTADDLFQASHRVLVFAWRHSSTHSQLRELLSVASPAHPDLVEYVLANLDDPPTDLNKLKETSKASREAARSVSPLASCDATYPHCKNYDWSLGIGPKDVSLGLSAGYYMGTNFDCKQDHLNYKLAAYGKAHGNFFGHGINVFDAQAEYSAVGGATSVNRLFVSMWGTTLKSGPLIPVSTKPCPAEKVENIWQASPGLHYKFYVLIGPVPITFDVGVTAHLRLDWGHLVCPQDLQGMVDLRPGVTVVASAGASVSVLVAKAGIEIAGSVNQRLVPAAWINGNRCQFGVDVHRQADPCSIKFDGWWQHLECHIHHWHVHCGMGSRHAHDFWHWNGNPVNQLIWGEVCTARANPFSVTCAREQ